MRSIRLRGLSLFAVMTVTVVAACGGDDGGDGELRSRLIDVLVEEAFLSADEAECYSEILIDGMDEAVLRQAIDAGQEPDIPDAIAERVFDECLDVAELLDELDLEFDLDFDVDDLEQDAPSPR